MTHSIFSAGGRFCFPALIKCWSPKEIISQCATIPTWRHRPSVHGIANALRLGIAARPALSVWRDAAVRWQKALLTGGIGKESDRGLAESGVHVLVAGGRETVISRFNPFGFAPFGKIKCPAGGAQRSASGETRRRDGG